MCIRIGTGVFITYIIHLCVMLFDISGNMFSAKALYNNLSEAPDELSFSKGDILEVIEKNSNGWWLCSFKGNVGIAPGNRLQPLPLTTLTKSASSSGRNSPSQTQTLMHAETLPSVSSTHFSKKSALDLHVKPSWHSSGKVCCFFDHSGDIAAVYKQLNLLHMC